MQLNNRLMLMRWACLGMAIASYALGGWIVIQPNGFWDMMGIPSAGNGELALGARAIYGGAILGEGIALTLVFLRPIQYLGFLHYMIAYKSAACIALATWIAGIDPAPLGAWAIFAGWAAAGVIAAAIYPWGRWEEILKKTHPTQADPL